MKRIVHAVLGLATISLLLLPGPASAQTARTARIQVTVSDSVHARPLAGAVVILTRDGEGAAESRSGTTDAEGRLRFDTLEAGRYMIGFEAPLLDSLQLSLADRTLALATGEQLNVALALPSAATLRASACPGLALASGQGAVVGQVSDADTDRPLAGATVAVGWAELSVDPATLRPSRSQRSGAVKTDSLGRYRLCGVPTGTNLLMQVQQGGLAGSALRLAVDDTLTLLVRNLSLSLVTARPIAEEPTARDANATRVPAPLVGTASLSGTVRGGQGEPIAGAHVRVVETVSRATTDSLGRFTLQQLPAGTQLVEVRRIGYGLAAQAVELRSGKIMQAGIVLSRIVSLDSVLVVARRVRFREFDERARHASFGRFLDDRQIAAKHPFQTSDLVRMLPGFRVVSNGFETRVVSSRGATSLRGGGCEANVVIDGMPGQDIDLVRPADIGGMEVYAGGTGAPLQYQSQCGVILIWTKR